MVNLHGHAAGNGGHSQGEPTAATVPPLLGVLFLGRIRSDTGLGFEAVGWTAWIVENPGAEPPAWRIRRLATPPNPLGVLVGFAAVLGLEEYVYAFGSQDPVKSHPVCAVRWPAEQVRQGNLLHPEWWAGDRLGWVPDSSSTPRYRPPEYYRPTVMIYAAKAHPELTGSDLVLTYNTNTFQFAEHLTDSLIYSRFVRLPRCR